MRTPFDINALVEDIDTLELRAGGRGGTRQIQQARVIESVSELPSCSAHQLLVLSPNLLADVVGSGRLRDLAARGIAGICATEPIETLDPATVDIADEMAVPILVPVHPLKNAEQLVVGVLKSALDHHRRLGTDTVQTEYAAITLEELIAAEPARNAQAIERAASLGWDLGRPRAVLLASIDPPVDQEVADRALMTIAASARATLGDQAIVWTRSTSVAALLAPTDASAVERRQLAEALRKDLDQRVRSVTLSIGVGRCVDEPGALPTSFVDAARAVDVGRWAKGRHITELYDELGLERLFASVPQRDLHDFVVRAIGPLLDHDRQNRSELVQSLSTWLQTRNMAEASRRMFVHYNTFKNRLERIEAILGPVLADPGRLLECEVAIYVAHHYEGPWSDESATSG